MIAVQFKKIQHFHWPNFYEVTGDELSIVRRNESTSASARVGFPSTIE
jgi:hypothetical protein